MIKNATIVVLLRGQELRFHKANAEVESISFPMLHVTSGPAVVGVFPLNEVTGWYSQEALAAPKA